MKKLFLTLLVSILTLTASAQAYIGGGVGLWRNTDDNFTSFTLKPEIGYNLSSKWALGIGLNYTHLYSNPSEVDDDDYGKVNTFSLDPYARWSFVKFGPVSLFLDMGFGIGVYKEKSADDSYVSWNVGVSPGVKVSLAKHIDFIAHAGFLGFKGCDDELVGKNVYARGFGFNLDSQSLTFGLNYNF